MPLYFLSIAKKIIQVQRNLFWAGEARKRGIPLVPWDIIQKQNNLGALGVGDIIEKNAALIFK